jgi:hypothetical protein
MFVMSGAFGPWRAGIISKASFSAGVTAVVLVLLGATTWAGDGVWAPDGAYARFVAPIIALVWVAVVSGFLYRRRPGTVRTPARAAVPAT